MPSGVGRVSGATLRVLAALVERPFFGRLLTKVVRAELGIDAARALAPRTRGPVPFGVEPHRARLPRAAVSDLPLPPTAVPRASRALTAAYRSRETTPLAVVGRALAAAETFGPRAPLCTRDDERALAEARAATERFERGAPLGELDGVPLVVKEEIDALGFPTRLGTSFMPATPAGRDAPLVARLRRAGAIVIGQTPMTEYGLSPLGVNPHRRMPRNARSVNHLAGGSSTGSAVAVALGLAPLGLGTDGGGSIRLPAAYNGVFGLKPTYGRVPCTGDGMFGGTSVVHFGFIGASSHDIALALELGSGPDAGDPASLVAPPLAHGECVAALGRGVRGLKLGVPEGEWASAGAAVARAGKDALRALEREGAELVPLELPLARHAAAIGYMTISLEALVGLREVLATHAADLGADLRIFLASSGAFQPDDYVEGQRLREALRVEMANALRRVDLVCLPSSAGVAPPITDAEAASGILDTHALDAACRFAFLGNLTGLPACSAPVGEDAGLALGLQFVGDAWDEACVLAAMAHLERLGVTRLEPAPNALDLLKP
ncbi:MAG TPA: amidase [Polyangiaceae bacterium]|nr:amidase [Polyangiaceae bacterium]